ncbi:MAG TPA: efflux RND transporter permease subunit [Tepidisphaeraceae bacterium]|jgi:HAE1 family hydrophobic/amphiphilic exporter-1
MLAFIGAFVRRPVFASMIILAGIVVGAAAYTGLGVDRFPSVDLPTVSVRTSLPGAAPEEMETEVSEEIEQVVNTVDGIDELRSISAAGNSIVIATFSLDRDIESAAQDVRDKVATVISRLPEEADPPVISKFDNDSTPVVTFTLSGERSLRELTEIADKLVKVQLERSKGVGEVRIVGGALRTVNITLSSSRLNALGIPVTVVRDAIVRQNSEIPGGNLTGAAREASLRTLGRLNNAGDFLNIVLTTVNGKPVYLRDVADVEDAQAEQRSLSRLDGKPSVALDILRQSGANTIAVIEGVKAQAQALQDQLPPGVQLLVNRDQSSYIYAALHEINLHLVLGSVLACLVVLAFTRSWRSTVIAGVAIPASVITTFAMMAALDFTLNSVTMLALVLMVGIVIDDAIVVLENIFRYVEEKKMPPMEAAMKGTGEIATAVLATTLSLAVIFVPVSFMSSISGRFLYQFGITAAVSVMVSLAVSFILTPTLSARMLVGEAKRLEKKGGHGGSRGGFYGVIDRGYTFLLKLVMRGRWAAAVVAALIIASSIPLFLVVQKSYLPEGVDEAEFEVRVEAPLSLSFDAMNDVMLRVEADLMAMPEIRSILSKVGSGFIGGVNNGEIAVKLPPHEERVFGFGRLFKSLLKGDPGAAFRGNFSQSEVMDKITASLRKYRDLRIQARNFPGFNIGGGNFDVDLSISGPDLNEIARITEELTRRGLATGGFRNLNTTLRLDKPEVNVTIDRARAADLGVTPQDIGTALRLLVGGDEEVTRYRDPGTNENYDVRLRLAPEDRGSADQIPQLFLTGSNNQLVELRNIASVSAGLSAARVDRLDRVRDARVRGFLASGAALQTQINVLLAEAEKIGLPPGYNITVRGAGKEFERTYQEFGFAFALSIVFMYMILASQYEHLMHPLTILLSLPLCLPFALLSLYLFDQTLNLYSALGLLVLFGVVKKNSILQVDHMNQLRAHGMTRYDAVIEGNRDRLRPILMTTLALVAGMLPLAMGTGPGAEERRNVAIIVIGGQTLSLLITLLVTPAAYTLLDDLSQWLRRRREVKIEQPAAAPGGVALGK